jgi:hypothetical protein
MYGKVFSQMYEGSLYGQWEAIVTFQQMIVLCDAEGYVDMTPPAIAARTSIPLDIILKGIELLESPDKYSRTPDCDGRRIELVDPNRPWGWRIVNYLKYRQMASAEDKREADRKRIADKRASERDRTRQDATSSEVSQTVADVAHVEAEAEAKKIYGASPLAHDLVIEAFHEILPELPRVKSWPERRRQKLRARIAERVKQGKPADTVDYWRSLFRKVAGSDFLCGRKTDWRADLEWLLESKHFDKLIEGGYDNGGGDGRR